MSTTSQTLQSFCEENNFVNVSPVLISKTDKQTPYFFFYRADGTRQNVNFSQNAKKELNPQKDQSLREFNPPTLFATHWKNEKGEGVSISVTGNESLADMW